MAKKIEKDETIKSYLFGLVSYEKCGEIVLLMILNFYLYERVGESKAIFGVRYA